MQFISQRILFCFFLFSSSFIDIYFHHILEFSLGEKYRRIAKSFKKNASSILLFSSFCSLKYMFMMAHWNFYLGSAKFSIQLHCNENSKEDLVHFVIKTSLLIKLKTFQMRLEYHCLIYACNIHFPVVKSFLIPLSVYNNRKVHFWAN